MPKPIFDTLKLLQSGVFLELCSDLLAETVKSVDETGKAGKLVITLDLKKTNGAIAIASKVTNKAPEKAADADLLWPTVEGNLSQSNPNQRPLDFHAAQPAAREVETVDRSSGEVTFLAAR